MKEIEHIETPRQALTLFDRVGMTARNLSSRTRTDYTNDLTDLITYLGRLKSPIWARRPSAWRTGA